MREKSIVGELRYHKTVYSVRDVLELLLSGPSSKSDIHVRSEFTFYQKELSKLILVDGGTLALKYFFGVEDVQDLEQLDYEFVRLLFIVTRNHLKHVELDGRTLLITYILPTLVENKQDIENVNLVTKFLLSVSGTQLDEQETEKLVNELKICTNSLSIYIKSQEGKKVVEKLHELLSKFLFEKTPLEQKEALGELFRTLGSAFIDFIGKDSGLFGSDSSSSFLDDELVGAGTISDTLRRESSELIFSSQAMKRTIHVLHDSLKNRKVVPSGIKDFDELYLKGGFETSRVYVFCARPGFGKSLLLLNFAYNASKLSLDDGFVVYITLENDLVESTDRLLRIVLSSEGHSLPHAKKILNLLKDGKDISSIDKSTLESILQLLGNRKLVIKYFPPGTSITTIFSWLSTFGSNEKLKLILVDYLSLLKSSISYEAKRFELGQVTLDLKNMARYFQIPVVTAAQLNTSGYEGIPTIKNVDESRQVAQHADFVCLMFDPKSLHGRLHNETEESLLGLEPGGEQLFETVVGFNIDKNRKGPKGIVYLSFDTVGLRFRTRSEALKSKQFDIISSYLGDATTSSPESQTVKTNGTGNGYDPFPTVPDFPDLIGLNLSSGDENIQQSTNLETGIGNDELLL